LRIVQIISDLLSYSIHHFIFRLVTLSLLHVFHDLVRYNVTDLFRRPIRLSVILGDCYFLQDFRSYGFDWSKFLFFFVLFIPNGIGIFLDQLLDTLGDRCQLRILGDAVRLPRRLGDVLLELEPRDFSPVVGSVFPVSGIPPLWILPAVLLSLAVSVLVRLITDSVEMLS